MICPRCEKNNQDNASYCPYCGLSFTNWEMKLAKYDGGNNREERIYIIGKPEGKTKQKSPALFAALKKEILAVLLSTFGKHHRLKNESAIHSFGILFLFTIFIALSGGLYSTYGMKGSEASFFTFGKGFLQSLLASMTLLVVSGGAIYWIVNHFMRRKEDIGNFFLRFSSFHTLSLATSILLFFFVLFRATTLIPIVFGLFQIVEISIIISLLASYVSPPKNVVTALYPGILICGGLMVLLHLVFGNQLPIPFFPI